MAESKAVSKKTSANLSIWQRAKSQADTIVFGGGFVMWAIGEAIPASLGSFWEKIPFLPLAFMAALISIGRNWSRIWGTVTEYFSSYDLEFRKGRSDLREVFVDIKFKEKFSNPKITIDVYKSESFIPDGCVFIKNVSIKKRVASQYNAGDILTARVLWYNPAERLTDMSDVTYVDRGRNENMGCQYRIVVTITADSKAVLKRHADVYLPSGRYTDFMLHTMGIDWCDEPKIDNSERFDGMLKLFDENET